MRDLPEILGDLAAGPYPEYIDDILVQSAAVRQRPAWMFPERWIPMVDTVRLPAAVPRLPWRAISLTVLLLALLLAAAVALFVGSPQRLPAPFGVAKSGLVAYDAGGDLFTADPVTGAATAILTGPEQDYGPRFSLDGRYLAFERWLASGQREIYIARADGRGLTLVTPKPVTLAPAEIGREWETYKFSPDGRTLLIATQTAGVSGLSLAQTDGSGMRVLDVGMPAAEGSFRPPDGTEVLFIGTKASNRGLFALNVAKGTVRPVLELRQGFDLAGPSWSPDGSRIAYWTWNGEAEGMNARSHVVLADGTADQELPSPAGAVWNAHATWSNDGTRLFLARGYTPGNEDVRGVVLPADGSSDGIEIAPAGSVETACCAAWIWSPDDTRLLGRATGRGGSATQVLLDPSGGPVRPAPWSGSGDPAWQRLAP